MVTITTEICQIQLFNDRQILGPPIFNLLYSKFWVSPLSFTSIKYSVNDNVASYGWNNRHFKKCFISHIDRKYLEIFAQDCWVCLQKKNNTSTIAIPKINKIQCVMLHHATFLPNLKNGWVLKDLTTTKRWSLRLIKILSSYFNQGIVAIEYRWEKCMELKGFFFTSRKYFFQICVSL